MRRLWIAFALVLILSFIVLGWIGTRIYQEMPPIPEKIMMTDGQTLFGSGEITAGQNVWQLQGGKAIYIIGDFDFVISSTLVREEWKKGLDVSGLVPKAVAECMAERAVEISKYWK